MPHNHSYTYGPAHQHPTGSHCAEARGQRTAFCQARAAAQVRAGFVMSEPYILSAMLTPLLGATVDRLGGRASLALFSAALLAASHALLALSDFPAEALLLGLGLGYATFASVIWPAIPSVVERRLIGTAYGLITVCGTRRPNPAPEHMLVGAIGGSGCVHCQRRRPGLVDWMLGLDSHRRGQTLQNFGLFLLPLAVGAIVEASSPPAPGLTRYTYASLFFAALSLLGVVASLWLCSDRLTRIALNTPGGMLPSATPSPVSSRDASPPGARRSPLAASPLSSPYAATTRGPAASVRVGVATS